MVAEVLEAAAKRRSHPTLDRSPSSLELRVFPNHPTVFPESIAVLRPERPAVFLCAQADRPRRSFAPRFVKANAFVSASPQAEVPALPVQAHVMAELLLAAVRSGSTERVEPVQRTLVQEFVRVEVLLDGRLLEVPVEARCASALTVQVPFATRETLALQEEARVGADELQEAADGLSGAEEADDLRRLLQVQVLPQVPVLPRAQLPAEVQVLLLPQRLAQLLPQRAAADLQRL